MPHLTPPRPWEPLSDKEWAVLAPYFIRPGGRPPFDLRGRINAVFRLVTTNLPWRALPAEHGPADSAHRQFRRWAHAGVWETLLRALARPRVPAVLRRLEYWICRAFRRAWRILGLRGVVLARSLGFHSALRAPPWMLPDPALSERVFAAIDKVLKLPVGQAMRARLRPLRALLRLAGGHARIPRGVTPP